jgi:hypothetical protein
MTAGQARELGLTLLRVFIGGLLAQLIMTGVGVLDMGVGDWKMAANAGLAAALVAAFNFVNPADARYGIGSRQSG